MISDAHDGLHDVIADGGKVGLSRSAVLKVQGPDLSRPLFRLGSCRSRNPHGPGRFFSGHAPDTPDRRNPPAGLSV